MTIDKVKKSITQINKRFLKGSIKAYYLHYFKYKGKAYNLTKDIYFPPHSTSNKNLRMGPCGELLAIGGDLTPERMIFAYKNGIYPMYFENYPILWWTSEIRCVIFPNNIHISKGVRNFVKKTNFRLTVDSAFKDVVYACRETREESTWITPERITASCKLHELGIAHSFEIWDGDQLIGGSFGVAMGSYFYGESQFTRVSNAGKVAMVALCLRLDELNYSLVDGGFWPTKYLKEMGSEIISREAYLKILEHSVCEPDIVKNWSGLFENWDLRLAIEKHLKQKSQTASA